MIRLVSGIRAVRAEMNVPPKAELPLVHKGATQTTQAWLETYGPMISRLARLDGIGSGDDFGHGVVQLVVDEATYGLPVGGVVDLDQEGARLKKEIDKLAGEIDKLEKKLANENFVARAPAAVVEEQKERRNEAEAARSKLAEALARIEAA